MSKSLLLKAQRPITKSYAYYIRNNQGKLPRLSLRIFSVRWSSPTFKSSRLSFCCFGSPRASPSFFPVYGVSTDRFLELSFLSIFVSLLAFGIYPPLINNRISYIYWGFSLMKVQTAWWKWIYPIAHEISALMCYRWFGNYQLIMCVTLLRNDPLLWKRSFAKKASQALLKSEKVS